jgi:hypothetical protein
VILFWISLSFSSEIIDKDKTRVGAFGIKNLREKTQQGADAFGTKGLAKGKGHADDSLKV